MSDILQGIVRDKCREVAAARSRVSLADLRRRAGDAPPARDFFAAVTTPPDTLRVIAEVKKASPSAGLIRPDFDPVAIARAYHRGGAAAISCLTDEKYFQGQLEYIGLIRQAVPLPVLRKDFLIDEYQLYESRAAQADAVLLIAECLDGAALPRLLALAGELGLTALVELHDADNLDRVRAAMEAQPRTRSLLGINNRDLRAMKTDLGHTLRLLERVPRREIVVSESGIRSAADVARLRAAGVHRILVGEHLMRQPDVETALRELAIAQP